eukprot:scaffold9878_cov45-Attheya_sp.AAC.1
MAFCDSQNVDVEDLPAFGMVVHGKTTLFEERPTSKALHQFALDQMPNDLVINVNHPTQIDERLLDPVANTDAKVGAVLLLTDKYDTSPVYSGLAYQYRSQLIFGESRAQNLNMAKALGVKKYPLLLVFVPKGTGDQAYSNQFDMIRYTNKVKSDAVSKWLDNVLKKIPPPNNETKKRRRARSEF